MVYEALPSCRPLQEVVDEALTCCLDMFALLHAVVQVGVAESRGAGFLWKTHHALVTAGFHSP